MSLFSTPVRTNAAPILNDASSPYDPNVSQNSPATVMAGYVDPSVSAKAAADSATQAAASATDAANSASSAASSASQAAASAQQAISYASGWEEAYDAAEAAVQAADQAVDQAGTVYYGFINMKTTAESVPSDQDADATWNASTYTMDFKIPKGLDGDIEGLADAPIITDPDKTDYIMIVDASDMTVKKETIDDFLDMTVKSVNGYTPDDNGNINLPSDDTNPVLYLGETVIGSFQQNPQGAVPADGAQYSTDSYPDVWAKIQSGELASVDEQTWQAGTNNVFSQGSGGTLPSGNWFRVPNLKDDGQIVMTKGDYTITGNITFTNPIDIPELKGTTIQDGDLIVRDTSRSVGFDTYIVNRMASEGTGVDYAAVAFLDRNASNKVIGGLFANEDTNVVSVLAQASDLDVSSQTGNVVISAPAGDIVVQNPLLANQGMSVTGNLVAPTVVGDTTIQGALNVWSKIETSDTIYSGKDITAVNGYFAGNGKVSLGMEGLTNAGQLILNGAGNNMLIYNTDESINSFSLATNEAGTAVLNGGGGSYISLVGDDPNTAITIGPKGTGIVRLPGTLIASKIQCDAGYEQTNTRSDAYNYQWAGATYRAVSANAINGASQYQPVVAIHGATDQAGYNNSVSFGKLTSGAAEFGSASIVVGKTDIDVNGLSADNISWNFSSNGLMYCPGGIQAQGDINCATNIIAQGTLYHNGTVPVTSMEEVHAHYLPIVEELRAEIAALKEKLNA